MPLPAQAMSMIKQFEGFTERASWDYAQYSNGYGTKARFAGEVISHAEAEKRFRSEIAHAASLVEKFAPDLDAGTKAALTSLTFNAGTKWMHDGLGRAVKSGETDEVRRIFVMYHKAGGETLPGLVARRNAEVQWIGRDTLEGAAPPPASSRKQPIADRPSESSITLTTPLPDDGSIAHASSPWVPSLADAPINVDRHATEPPHSVAALTGSEHLTMELLEAILHTGQPDREEEDDQQPV